MSNPDTVENNSKEAKEARAAVERGENIHDAMRDITLGALQRGQLNAKEIRQVVRSVMQGASMGVTDAGVRSRLALSEAFAGIDDALAKSAEASKLAIEEAAGRLQDYAKQDLERAFDDMRSLESMFLDTLKDVAEHSADAAREVLHDLWQHARDSGTAAGTTATAALESLEQKLGRTLREVTAAGADVALSAGSRLADAASGFLAGISAALAAKAKNSHHERK
jgi:polyhydroxyalkanoate synthesis regulator phasin